MRTLHSVFPLFLLLLAPACGSSEPQGDESSATAEASKVAASALTACPASGTGAIQPQGGAACYVVTPEQAGASAGGDTATAPSYALTSGARTKPNGKLVLFFNGSGGAPAGELVDPTVNFYNAASELGYAVLALSYASDNTIASLCGNDDGCYFATRENIIFGRSFAGAATTYPLDVGIADRVVLTLRYLAAKDPSGPWSSFLAPGADAGAAPEDQINWPAIVSAGHSQGGGHAAAIGKLFPVARVLQLSSTCDEIDGEPISWTSRTNGTWATAAAEYYGLGVETIFRRGVDVDGDTTCPYHAANWANLEMSASNENDQAVWCTQYDAHAATIKCTGNFSNWQTMLK